MRKIIYLIAVLGLSSHINAQLLWKITGEGLEKPSYIFGTHHLASYSIMDSIKGLKPAFESCETVVGELSLSEMTSSASVSYMQNEMMMSDGKLTRTLFTPEEYAMVNNYVISYMGVDMAQIPHMKPAYITNNMVILLHIKQHPEYDPTQQLDLYFQKEAGEKGKACVGLESMPFQVQLLFNMSPVERQAELLVCMLSDVNKSLDMVQKISEVYMRQDLEEIYALSTLKEGTNCDMTDEEYHTLFDARNIDWMGRLPGWMYQHPTFVAVGAGHLAGENGLLNLFRKAGFTIEAVK